MFFIIFNYFNIQSQYYFYNEKRKIEKLYIIKQNDGDDTLVSQKLILIAIDLVARSCHFLNRLVENSRIEKRKKNIWFA